MTSIVWNYVILCLLIAGAIYYAWLIRKHLSGEKEKNTGRRSLWWDIAVLLLFLFFIYKRVERINYLHHTTQVSNEKLRTSNGPFLMQSAYSSVISCSTFAL